MGLGSDSIHMGCKKSKPKIQRLGKQREPVREVQVEEESAAAKDGAQSQPMTVHSVSRLPVYRASWRLASSIAHHPPHSYQPELHLKNDEKLHPAGSSEAWFVKIVYTLSVFRRYPLQNSSDFVRQGLTSSNAFEVLNRLRDHPELAFHFFSFSRVTLNLTHLYQTYEFLVRLLYEMGFYDLAEMIFGCIKDDGFNPTRSLAGGFLMSLAQAGRFNVAKSLLLQLENDQIQLSLFQYNSLLKILVKQNLVPEAVSLFREHLILHTPPDAYSFNTVIHALCRVKELGKAFEFLHEMKRFDCCPDILTFNTLIAGLCKVNEADRAYTLLKELISRYRISPDVVSYTSVISGYGKLGNVKEAAMIFSEMIQSGTKPNIYTYNILIDAFGKDGDMPSAISMYEKMLSEDCNPDVVTLTSLIDGYCRSCQLDQGLKIWNEMGIRNVSPNLHTYCIIIHALCRENRLHEAHGFLRQLKVRNIVPKAFVYNPLIDAYCKSGSVEEAVKIMIEMEEMRCRHDKMTYTILIIGLCMKGRMSEAVSIFHKMLATKCTPDNITRKSLISCLMKAGMVNEAYQIEKIFSDNSNIRLPPVKRDIRSEINPNVTVSG